MNINEFIAQHNLHVPSVEQIISKFQRTQSDIIYSEAAEDRKRMFIETKNGENELSDTVEDLIFKTNIASISVGSIYFGTAIGEIEGSFKEFASYNDYYKICLDQENGSIVFYDEGQNSFDPISISFNQFLHFLYIYTIYDRSVIFGDGTLASNIRFELERLIENGLDNWFVSMFIFLD